MSNAYNTDGLFVFPANDNEGCIMNAFESIECTIAFDVKDWSESRRDAWIYAIVFGWSDEDEYAEENEHIMRIHNWDAADIKRAKELHRQWVLAKEFIGFLMKQPMPTLPNPIYDAPPIIKEEDLT